MPYKPMRFEVMFQSGIVAEGTFKEVVEFLGDWFGEIAATDTQALQVIQRQTVIRLFVALDDNSDCICVGEQSLQSLST